MRDVKRWSWGSWIRESEALGAAKEAMRRGLDLPLGEGLGVEVGLARGAAAESGNR